jgi:hypothetical protein
MWVDLYVGCNDAKTATTASVLPTWHGCIPLPEAIYIFEELWRITSNGHCEA